MKSIQFKSPGNAVLVSTNTEINKGTTIVRNIFSIVSPGTELAILSGTEGWAPLPYYPGYGSVGIVINEGTDFSIPKDTLVFTYGLHSELTPAETVCIPLPEGLAPEEAVFARMAAVSMTAIRCSEISLGDKVFISGAGLVGNLAAQLAEASGAQAIISDPCENRRRIAKECGISYALDPNDNLLDKVMEITGGMKCSTLIEATGIAAIAESGMNLIGKQGELILLGSPRAPYNTNLTTFLNKAHLCPDCITIKGAHEWRYPVKKDELNRHKFSIERNIEDIFTLMNKGQLITAPLLTHCSEPDKAQTIYDGLTNDKDNYLGIIFNWESISK